MSKIVKPLNSFHVKRRKGRGRRLSTRVDGEPVMMMVRLMRAKKEVSIEDMTDDEFLKYSDKLGNKTRLIYKK